MRAILHLSVAVCLTGLLSDGTAAQQTPFKPSPGQAGKDVVWMPTPEALVEKMLDLAKVTSDDFVVDLGSGDGRNVIGAARRGARALGVEFNPDMVALSRFNAERAGVSHKVTFVEGDMYAADISNASALVLFLLPHNLEKPTPAFLELRPGTRISTIRSPSLAGHPMRRKGSMATVGPCARPCCGSSRRKSTAAGVSARTDSRLSRSFR